MDAVMSKSGGEMRHHSQSGKVARNVVKNHGKKGLEALLNGWVQGVDNATLARDLGISRERIRQLKGLLVDVQITVTPRPGVSAALGQLGLFGGEE
jgi:hypothetical protein